MVYLVGAGPGDAGLLTLRACELLRAADVVIYDRLADDAILNFCAGAKKIYVGKEAGHHTLKQSEINQLLVDTARQNKIVVRLKGGDPFVFGRGGEEALALRENNLPFEIVPGVTSAVAVPAYAGIPVTHRGLATSFAVVTGHEDPNKPESSINWAKLSTAVDTLIFLMGVANLPQIVDKLIAHGRKPDTPAALIRWGTKSAQEVVVTTLADAPHAKILPPAIFVVGEVVNLRDKLKWFETRPLFGKKILVTRARAQASKLSSALKNLGASVVECPTIKIAAPPDNFRQLDAAIKILRGVDAQNFDGDKLAVKDFTSEKNSDFGIVDGENAQPIDDDKFAVTGSTAEKNSDFGIVDGENAQPIDDDKFAVTGSTAEKNSDFGIIDGDNAQPIDDDKFAVKDSTADKDSDFGIVDGENAQPIDDDKFAVKDSTADKNSDFGIVDGENAQPIDDDKFAVKDSTADKNSDFGIVDGDNIALDEFDAAIKNVRGFDWLIFTSANGVEKFFERLKFHGLDTRTLGGVKVAAIGSATAEKLSNVGIIADVVPKDFVAESLVDALKDFVRGKKILLARAQEARDTLPDALKNFGAEVVVAPAYQTRSETSVQIDFDALDMITFTSSSTVKNFVAAYGVDCLKKIPSAAIGTITARTLETFDVTPAVVAEEFTIAGLVEAIEKFYEQR